MPQRVQYSDTIEPLVQFIEDTPPAEILDRTLDKLRAGVADPDHADRLGARGDPLHRNAARSSWRPAAPAGRPPRRSRSWSSGLEGEQRFLPVLQHVALTNKHINHPAMGPFSLLEFAPEDAGGATPAARPRQ